MLLLPKKFKYFKPFINKKLTNNWSNNDHRLKYSHLALISNQSGFISNRQIETVRLLLRRLLKKKGQIYYCIFPNYSITKKPNEVRLGRGKGNVKYWACFIKKNTILIELTSYNIKMLILALLAVKYKLGIKCFILNKHIRWIL